MAHTTPVCQSTISVRTLVDASATPSELWQYRQFIDWKYTPVPSRPKPDKTPINAHTLGNAGVTWANTWATIDVATSTYHKNDYLAGIGFVLTSGDPYVMVDLDNCLVNEQLSTLAEEVVNRLDTYTEVSPSCTGLRLFVYCPQQPAALKRDEIEIYSSGRFATLTGDVLNDKPIAKVDDLDWLIQRFRVEQQKQTHQDPQLSLSTPQQPTADDAELWQRICKFNKLANDLYNGNVQAAHGDDSRAVILLLNSLALWTKGDAARMDRMIRQASLDSAKFDTKRGNQTWLDGRIQDAIRYMGGRL